MSAHLELVEGCSSKPPMVRQIHHDRVGKHFAIVLVLRAFNSGDTDKMLIFTAMDDTYNDDLRVPIIVTPSS